jgi:leader peptidase (prepilin peptidase) / N-methyltransferase
MQIEPLVYALFGLIIGSFLNVCIYRIPLGKSIVYPGSGCPHCGTAIRFYDNIPVLSFLMLRGKCRSCGKPISVQYPFVELMSGLAFYCCWKEWGLTPPTFVNSLFLSIIIVLIFTDYHHQILPNKLTLPGLIAGLLLSPFQTPEVYLNALSIKAASLLGFLDSPFVLSLVGSVLGAVIGGGGLFALAFFYERVRKKQGLGMGDVKMMAMVGAFMGIQLAILTILIGSLLGTLVGIYLILFRKMNMQTKLPLGVFLGIGSAFSLFYGLFFIHWYWNIFR